MKKEHQMPHRNHKCLYLGLLIIAVCIFLILLPFIFAKATNTDAPSSNLATFSSAGNPTAQWYDAWSRKATGTASGGFEYFPYLSNQYDFYYKNWNHMVYPIIYNDESDNSPALRAWMTAKGRREEDAWVHWKINTGQRHGNYTGLIYSRFVPGWNPANDADSNFIRDSIADYDHNWNTGYTHFTVDLTNAIITDSNGGMWYQYYDSVNSWTVGMWQNAKVVLSWGGDADTIQRTVDSNNAHRLYLSGGALASHSYTWFVVDRGNDYRSCAMTDTVARASMYGYCERNMDGCTAQRDWGYNQVCVNHGDPDVISFFCSKWAETMREWRDSADVIDTNIHIGIHKDNVFVNCKYGDKLRCVNIGGADEGCNALLETEWQTENGYVTAESLGFVYLQDSTASIARTIIEGNVGDYKTDSSQTSELIRYGNAMSAADMIMFEDICGFDATYAGVNGWIPVFQQEMEKRGRQCYVMWDNSYCRNDAGTSKNERFIQGLAFYYTLMKHRSSYNDSAGYIFMESSDSYGNSANDTLCWSGGQAKYPMGYPTYAGTCSTFSKSGSPRGWIRRYQNGIAVYHPRHTSNNDTVSVSLGGTYYLVKDDGTLDPNPVTTCNITNYYYSTGQWGGQGRIYGTMANPDSLWQVSSKVDSTASSVKIRDSIYTLYTVACDSAVLYLDTNSTLVGASREDIFTNDNVDTLEATGLSPKTTYCYWTIVCDTGVCDTTAYGIIHTLSHDSLDQFLTEWDVDTTWFIIRDSIYTNTGSPCDSVYLYTNTIKSWTGAVKKDYFTNLDTGMLEATGLYSGWEYYYRTVAWDSSGVYSDTTEWDSITTLSPPSQSGSFTTGASLIYDTWIDDANNDFNCGGATTFEVGHYYSDQYRNALIQVLNLGDSIPDGVTIDSGCIDIYLQAKQSWETGDTLAFKWYEILKAWGEGDNNCTQTNYGECSWDSAEQNIIDWQVDGCNGSADRSGINQTDGIHVDSIVILDSTTLNTKHRLWLDPNSLAKWDTTANYGILLKVSFEGIADENKRVAFYSCENATEQYRPSLTVWYSSPQLVSTTKRWIIRK